MERPTRAPRAFTLVELLVVIGIIAVLIGILLPVLSGVQARGRDLKCQSNLRTCVQLMLVYAAENKGSLPYGWYFNQGFSHEPPYDWNEKPGNNGRLITVFSLISRLAGKHYSGEDVFLDSTGGQNPDAAANAAPFLRCPEAEQAFPHLCSYVAQMTAFITPWYDFPYQVPGIPIQKRPAVQGELQAFTILIHDTAIAPGMSQDVGYVTDADIDEQRYWSPDIPQLRYYSISDPFARTPPGLRGNNRPVAFPSSWRNIDPEPTDQFGFAGYPYQGNLRFRHSKNTSVNVGYADGRVESISAKFNSDRTMRSHPVPRKAFMIKWPAGTGIGPNRSYPH